MRVGIVVQRYGSDCIGGAETLARLMAEQLVKRGHHVKVFTTTAVNYITWKNHFAEGVSQLNGVNIDRSHVIFPRYAIIFKFYNFLCRSLWKVIKPYPALHFLFLPLEYIWFRLQGPFSPQLVGKIKAESDKHDKFIFFTYLYYPTIEGLGKVKINSILIPTAHDETPFYFPRIKQLFARANRILVSTDPERKLILKRFNDLDMDIRLGTFGIETQPQVRLSSSEATKSLLYLGRIGYAKSIDRLIRLMMNRWNLRHDKLILRLAGEVEMGFVIPNHPAIKYEGVVSEEKKANLLQDSLAVVNPSRWESLSLLVLEGIAHRKQVIVNKESEVLNNYTEFLDTVYGYNTDQDFNELLDNELQMNPETIARQLEVSAQWVESNFSWAKVMSNIEEH